MKQAKANMVMGKGTARETQKVRLNVRTVGNLSKPEPAQSLVGLASVATGPHFFIRGSNNIKV
jgi:hypothetical protein